MALAPSRVCVFCGSSPGRDPAYGAAAEALGREIAGRGLGLVYGGASVGLMGVVADAVLAAGGPVDGVIPQDLVDREIAHTGVTELHVVASMHERKARMADLAGAFVALPGGLGTLEELFEIATWGMLGLHGKPLVLLDVGGYWSGLGAFLDLAVAERFLRPEHRALVALVDSPAAALDHVLAWTPPPVRSKWIDHGAR